MEFGFDFLDSPLYFGKDFIYIIFVIGVRLTIGTIAQDLQFLQNGVSAKSSQTLESITGRFVFIYFFCHMLRG